MATSEGAGASPRTIDDWVGIVYNRGGQRPGSPVNLTAAEWMEVVLLGATEVGQSRELPTEGAFSAVKADPPDALPIQEPAVGSTYIGTWLGFHIHVGASPAEVAHAG